ncbi:HalOD1 output domain-containing protein [Halorubrum halophilum]|uniref:HalOD1 output domain-containing protein n=1 Tax=Halorubrum halophilum TaxID=413816 RepID=UPI000678DF73|nr:HalOD1 output domain-containing protein [Halorubrum halophilum]
MNALEEPIPKIVDAVADAESVEPVTLDPPLAEVADPDAIETLVEDSTSAELEVRFAYRGHAVVDESGRVQVD